ncbi:MAG: hypothetical protein PHR35_21090 [Kiritimatiellae bacterium]|nr:hypothetical protein [Kiritimatiellia bacterium]
MAAGTPLRSIRRWRGRQRCGTPLLSVPGPAKVAPLELETLMSDLMMLAHGRHRTTGTGALYERFREQLSRRVIGELAELLRREYWRRTDAEKRRIVWLTPGLVWSMDDMEMLAVELGLNMPGKFYWNQMRDLASRYQFEPLTSATLATGEIVAARLKAMFAKYGPPLVMKQDNHGNLNNVLVDAVRSEYLVIPLNSPPHYPPYNGSMEKGQDEFQKVLRGKFVGRKWPVMTEEDAINVLQLGSEVAAHDLNQRLRPCLKGISSRHCFEVGKQDRKYYYDRNQRREVFEDIRAMASLAMAETKLTGRRAADAAWRLAVETWLRREGHITISVGGKVLPYLA